MTFIRAIPVAFAALAAMVAVPASAQSFNGPRVEVTAGIQDVTAARDTTDVTYGLNAGLDTTVLDSNVRLGVEVSTDNIFNRDREVGVAARAGYVFNDAVLVYGKAGYANFRNINFQDRATTLEGLRVGGGLEAALTDNVYGKLEYRYTDFNGRAGKHGAVAGFGLRF